MIDERPLLEQLLVDHPSDCQLQVIASGKTGEAQQAVTNFAKDLDRMFNIAPAQIGPCPHGYEIRFRAAGRLPDTVRAGELVARLKTRLRQVGISNATITTPQRTRQATADHRNDSP